MTPQNHSIDHLDIRLTYTTGHDLHVECVGECVAIKSLVNLSLVSGLAVTVIIFYRSHYYYYVFKFVVLIMQMPFIVECRREIVIVYQKIDRWVLEKRQDSSLQFRNNRYQRMICPRRITNDSLNSGERKGGIQNLSTRIS
jgi:hypothetical protein